jgi:hypothetical protein
MIRGRVVRVDQQGDIRLVLDNAALAHSDSFRGSVARRRGMTTARRDLVPYMNGT